MLLSYIPLGIYDMACVELLFLYFGIQHINLVGYNKQSHMRRNTAKAYCVLRIAPYNIAPQHRLNFLPLPHEHGAFLPWLICWLALLMDLTTPSR